MSQYQRLFLYTNLTIATIYLYLSISMTTNITTKHQVLYHISNYYAECFVIRFQKQLFDLEVFFYTTYHVSKSS